MDRKILSFKELSRRDENHWVAIGEGKIPVFALTPKQQAHLKEILNTPIPPQLTKPVFPTDDKGKPVTTTKPYEEVYAYDYENPEYQKRRRKAEQDEVLWAVYYGCRTLREDLIADSDEDLKGEQGDSNRVQRLGELVSANIIQKLYIAIKIATDATDQEMADFFSDGGLSTFRNSKTATDSIDSAPSNPEPTTTSAGSDTAEPTSNTSPEKPLDSGDTDSASGSKRAQESEPSASPTTENTTSEKTTPKGSKNK